MTFKADDIRSIKLAKFMGMVQLPERSGR